MAGRRVLLSLVLIAACAAPAQPPGQLSPSPTPAASTLPPTATVVPTASPSALPTSVPSPTAGQTAAPTDGASPAPTGGLTPAPTGGALPDALAWSRLDLTGGPSAREDHTWTLSADGASAYLYGGRARGAALGDLWRYDLATDTWSRLEPASPPPARWGHVAAWHDLVGLLIWSGQASADAFFDDIWAYDPQADAWQPLPSGGPLPIARYGSCGGIGPDGRLWVSHGFTHDEGRFRDTRAYDVASGQWADVTPASGPVERCLHDCLWTSDGRLVLYAGQTTGLPALGDLWTYDPTTNAWTEQPPGPPPARQLYALAGAGESAYVFGGGDVDGGYLDDLWRLSLSDLAWTQVALTGEGPSARAGAAFIFDAERGRLLLFGGQRRAGELDDLWVLAAAGG